jgi:hypothetical protein
MLIQIIKKEYRNTRIIDLFVISTVIFLTEYTKVHLLYILIFSLLPTRFLNVFWNHNSEKCFYLFFASEVFVKIIKLNKFLNFFELNLIFLLVLVIVQSSTVYYDLLIFNSYILLFSIVSDYLFIINTIPNRLNFSLIINTFVVIIVSAFFSFFLMLFINDNKIFFLSLIVGLLFLIQVINLVFFFPYNNYKTKIFRDVKS